MPRMCTLHEIALQYADRQPGMVDSLTEESPVLDTFKWIPASHKMWNVAERLTNIDGPAFTELDAPLPLMDTSSDLVSTSLNVMGGIMEVPTDRAIKFGGAVKYFADRQDRLLKDAGMKTEVAICQNVFLRGAVHADNILDCGAPDGGWFLLFVRYDDLANVGLYDPDQFDQGRLLNITALHGGNEDYLKGPGYEGVLGYAVAYRGHFGWQLLTPERCVGAMVNIDRDHAPTPDQIDNMLADIRATAGTTHIFCGPRAKIFAINKYKDELVRYVPADTEVKTSIDIWNGIPVIQSHNLNFTLTREETGTQN